LFGGACFVELGFQLIHSIKILSKEENIYGEPESLSENPSDDLSAIV
jgi:hypothetical protein